MSSCSAWIWLKLSSMILVSVGGSAAAAMLSEVLTDAKWCRSVYLCDTLYPETMLGAVFICFVCLCLAVIHGSPKNSLISPSELLGDSDLPACHFVYLTNVSLCIEMLCVMCWLMWKMANAHRQCRRGIVFLKHLHGLSLIHI